MPSGLLLRTSIASSNSLSHWNRLNPCLVGITFFANATLSSAAPWTHGVLGQRCMNFVPVLYSDSLYFLLIHVIFSLKSFLGTNIVTTKVSCNGSRPLEKSDIPSRRRSEMYLVKEQMLTSTQTLFFFLLSTKPTQ